jgi:hypothetical protein
VARADQQAHDVRHHQADEADDADTDTAIAVSTPAATSSTALGALHLDAQLAWRASRPAAGCSSLW